jgi:hypothetical protein
MVLANQLANCLLLVLGLAPVTGRMQVSARVPATLHPTAQIFAIKLAVASPRVSWMTFLTCRGPEVEHGQAIDPLESAPVLHLREELLREAQLQNSYRIVRLAARESAEIDQALCHRDPVVGTWLVVETGQARFPRGLARDRESVLVIVLEKAVIDRTVLATSVIGRIVRMRVSATIGPAGLTTGTSGTIFAITIGRKSITTGAIAGKTIGTIATIGSTAIGGTTTRATIGIGPGMPTGGHGQLGET